MGDFMNLYFDNASTSFPKPINVIKSVNHFISNIGANPNRGAYNSAIVADKIVFECREALCNLFNYNKPNNIIFTHNATYAFNIILNSLVNSIFFKEKPHVLISKFDHNSTIRPLIHLKNLNKIELSFITNYNNFFIDCDKLSCDFKTNTKLLVISHMSNVTGNINNIKKISEICKKNKIFLIIDIAQSAGVVNIDLSSMYFSAICFTGHKNLFSTQGVGGFVISNDLIEICENSFLGGTGSDSYALLSKDNMPDYFEVGTQNTLGIYSLLNGVRFINNYGVDSISSYKKTIIKLIGSELLNMDNLIIINDIDHVNQNSIISLIFKRLSVSEVGYILNRDFGVSVRVGLHCSPYSQKPLSLFPYGCVRISPGVFNSINDATYLISSLNKISKL